MNVLVTNAPSLRSVALRARCTQWSAIVLLADVYWLMLSGRWGSYASVPRTQIYLTDLLLGLSVLLVFPMGALSAGRLVHGRLARPWWGKLLLALLLWALVRFAVGPIYGLAAARDAAPYVYIVVAPLAIANQAVTYVRQWHLSWVFALHALWIVGVIGFHFDSANAPAFGSVHMFTLRTDFDAAICGAALVFGLFQAFRATRGKARAWWSFLVLLNGYLLLSLNNRAAVVATGAVLVALTFATGRRLITSVPSLHTRRRKLLGGLVCVLLLVLVAGAASQSATGRKILDTVTGSSEARGTVDARALVYRKVVNYVTEEPGRALVGVGFGLDYLHVTGADVIYEGTMFTGVRSPHNGLLNTWARLGVIGLLLHALILVAVPVSSIRQLRHGALPTSGALTATILVIVIPVTGMFGVILESPFGAVPYFAAVGALVSSPKPSRRLRGE